MSVPLQHGQAHERRAAEVEFFCDRLPMSLDGPRGYAEPTPELLIGKTVSESHEKLPLPSRQPGLDLAAPQPFARCTIAKIAHSNDLRQEGCAAMRLVNDGHDDVEQIGGTDKTLSTPGDEDALQAGVTGQHSTNDVHAAPRLQLAIDDEQVDSLEHREPLRVHHVGTRGHDGRAWDGRHGRHKQVEQHLVIVDDHASEAIAIRRHGKPKDRAEPMVEIRRRGLELGLGTKSYTLGASTPLLINRYGRHVQETASGADFWEGSASRPSCSRHAHAANCCSAR